MNDGKRYRVVEDGTNKVCGDYGSKKRAWRRADLLNLNYDAIHYRVEEYDILADYEKYMLRGGR